MGNVILLNKPFAVLSQFTDDEGRKTLADFLSAPGFRVAGRLDYDSEGLLVLTNDGALQQRIAHPRHKHWKTYWVQVEGLINATALDQLKAGVDLKDGRTQPARARLMEPPALWERDPPVRVRKTVPDSWFELSISEGKNRQVRRMTAAVGFPTLRLVRAQVGDWSLNSLLPGQHKGLIVHSPASIPKPRRPGRRSADRKGGNSR
ncbi:MAG: pseudouridine synthase [Halioglobus sp.]